ncbi:39 kDa initiator binding protein [Tritrichomonas foetus]|uniref:39 kDa initiator binding protein n=1 Tax=Tritrichomonas foetus TaxID=1144522 RepID=A0A1J4K7G4_9EUKA|nr:39 kDa initiator binding protein [Tritrichomonas foetus]|eukprot:OHT07139.1 39 kDa initiator binding protein [Tritrichomonas foetus]
MTLKRESTCDLTKLFDFTSHLKIFTKSSIMTSLIHMELMNPSDVVRMLPSNIQAILHRKSSRDPSSRFSRKLHALLSYVSANPEMEEQVGVSWLDDEIFQVCKKRLLEIMGIKLNTLNVNFHQLKFVQLQCDKQGWTRWRREGFTRREFNFGKSYNNNSHNNSQQDDIFSLQAPKDQLGGLPSSSTEEKIELKIGHMTSDQIDILSQHVQQEWQEIAGIDKKSVDVNYFVSTISARYKENEQPTHNAFDVLKAIFAPQGTDTVKFSDFYRFMAMFGPAKTVMLKIHSLLEVATAGTPWLYFGLLPSADFDDFYGHFDENEPNCLVLHKNDGTTTQIWNLPLSTSDEQYVIDDNCVKYASWQQYFAEHPPPGNETYSNEQEISVFAA